MIAQPHRRPLVAVPPVLVPTLGAMLRPALATVLAMVATFLARLTTVLAMFAALGLTFALRPLGALRALFAAIDARLVMAFAPLRALAALFGSTMPALLGAIPVPLGAMAALLGAPRTAFGALTAPFRAVAVPFCTMLARGLLMLARVLDALDMLFGTALLFRPLRARSAFPALARRPRPLGTTAAPTAPAATAAIRFLEGHELDARHLDARDGVANQLLDRLH